MMEINGLTIKKFREKIGKTQKQFADDLGVNLRTLQNYEGGEEISKPIKKLIEYEIISYSNENPSELKEPESNYVFNGDLGKLFNALNNISESVKLNAIANERNSRTMEKMVNLISQEKQYTNKQTGT